MSPVMCSQIYFVSKWVQEKFFTGIEKNNPVSKLGNINFWANSKAYNFVENIHQVWLLAIVDLIIGKAEYSSDPDES